MFTPFDQGFEQLKARLDITHAVSTVSPSAKDPRERGRSFATPKGVPSDSEVAALLERILPSGKFLQPSNPAYERAIFVGNLLYKLKTPAAVVMPRDTNDIIAIVKCARQNRLPLSVKNGGHSYAGYSLVHHGIVIDMSNMKRVEINHENMEVGIQAGCIWKEVYATLVDKDLANMIIGGQCPYVGVSGFTLGGGLSPFSRSYGLGIDNVTEMTVVTAAGELVTVNNHETDLAKRDLFWALHGGGGGNFGVLVEFKSKVHQLRDTNGQVCCGELTWFLPEQEVDFKAMMRTFNEMNCLDALTVDTIWRYTGERLVGQMTVIYNGRMEACKRAIQPLLDHDPIETTVTAMLWKDWMQIEEGDDIKADVYHHHVSFIFGRGAITPELIDKIISLMNESRRILGSDGKSHFLWDHIGGATSRVESTDTAFFWREGVYVSNIKIQWNHASMTEKAVEFTQHCKKVLLPHALQGKAAYLNYIDSTVENWQEAYYGANYDRLQDVKSRWDPTNFFRFEQGIMPKDQALPSGSKGIVKRPPPSAIERTLSQWAKFSLRDPQVIRDLDAGVEQVFDAIAAERQQKMYGPHG